MGSNPTGLDLQTKKELKKKYTPLIIEKNKKVTKIFNYRSFKSNYRLESLDINKEKYQSLEKKFELMHFYGVIVIAIPLVVI